MADAIGKFMGYTVPAAALVVLLFFLSFGFNLYDYCTFCWTLRRHGSTIIIHHAFSLNEHGRGAVDSGLGKSLISTLPTFEFKDKDDSPATPVALGSIECAVCLSLVEVREKVRVLPSCMHMFHVHCIDKWLQSRPTCPLCRRLVRPLATVPVPFCRSLSAS